MDKRWLCAGLSALCFLASAKMGWFRGVVLPMMGVGFLFAIMWFWFVERMGSVSKQADLYLPTPLELAALKQAALQTRPAVAAESSNPVSAMIASSKADPSKPAPSKPAIVEPLQPKAPVPTGRAVFNLGQEAPAIAPKPPQV